MRFLFVLLALIFSFESYPEMPNPEVGLPELASEDDLRLMQKRRSKVLTQSVARKVTTIVEALDEAGLIEDEKTLLIKAKKPEEAVKALYGLTLLLLFISILFVLIQKEMKF